MTDRTNTANTNSSLARMDTDRLSGLLSFLQAAEQLKDTLRSGTTREKRPESTAEHTWRLALMILIFERELEGIDFQRLLKLCLIHDLGEAISGDVPAPSQRQDDDRQERERRDFETLCAPLPEDVRDHLMALWSEYAAAMTTEAQLAKAFDKLETMLQHLLMPPGDVIFYEFNLTYGRDRTDFSPLTRQIRDLVDKGTRQIMEDLQKPASDT
ncbi:HD domain-containing protein [uncultured Roseibium sp.]|uniref:HD domain-containing protein n=1 Tax=uncultured Roseibium sp. TaxID=1936171 RepID=UPI00260B6F91|nr:HD domain-containing protein [uncultured Roseibium sp.]